MEKKSIAESVDGFVRKDTSDGTQGLKQKSDVGSAAVYDDAVKEMRKSDDLAKANIEPAVKASDELARQTADTKGAPVPKTADLKAMHLSEGFAEYLGENFSGVSGNVVRCTDASKARGLVECARRNGVRYSLRRIGEGFLFRFSGDAHALSEGRLDARQKKALRADLGDRVGSLGEEWTVVRDRKDAEYPWSLSVGGKRYDSLSLGEGLKISRMGKDYLKESAPTVGTVKVRIDGTPEAEDKVYDYLTRESKAVDAGKVERKGGLVWVNDIGSIPAHALALDLAERFGVDCTVSASKFEGLGAGGGKAPKLDHLVKTSNSPVYASDLGDELRDRGIRFAFADTGVWVSKEDYSEAQDALSELEQKADGSESLKTGRAHGCSESSEHGTSKEYCTMDCNNNNIDAFYSFDKAVESAKSDKEVCRILEVTYDLPADANGDIHESSAVEVWNRKDDMKESASGKRHMPEKLKEPEGGSGEHVLWSSEDFEDADIWRDDYKQMLLSRDDDLTDEEAAEEAEDNDAVLAWVSDASDDYFNDMRSNLSGISYSKPIIAIADLGLWNGRHSAYMLIESGKVVDCLSTGSDIDDASWYVTDGGEFKASMSHHDGTNEITYRVFKKTASDKDMDALEGLIYGGKATQADIDKATDRIGPDIAKVYGWTLGAKGEGLKESDGSDDLEPRYDGRKSFYGKATVRMFGDGRKVLYSYGTPVCRIDRNGHATLLNKGYYGWGSSNTTRRHVREFLRQNGLKADSSSQIGRDYPEEQARDDEGLEQAGGDYQVVLWECDGHMNPDYDSEVGCGRYGTLDEAVGSVKGAAKLSGGMIDEEYAVLDKSGNVVRTFFASTGKAAR